MKRFLPLVVALAVVGAAIGSGKIPSIIRHKLADWFSPEDAIPVKAVRVRRSSVASEVHGIGEFRPVQEMDIVATIPGVLQEMRYKVGDSVAAGQLVASLRATELIQRSHQAEAALEAAKADVREKETRLKDLEKELERARELRNRDLIAGQEVSAAEAAAATGRAQTELARAQAAQQQASLEQLRYLLSFSQVLAPFGGVVTRRISEPGSYVQRSEPIITLASLDVMRVRVKIPEKDLHSIHRGMEAQIKAEALPGRVFDGHVVALRSAPDAAGSEPEAEIHVKNNERLLTNGMRASVSLRMNEKRDALVVPQRAVREIAAKSYVDVVVNGRVQQRAVTVAGNQEKTVEITSGVHEGEWVIVDSPRPLMASSRVRMVTEKIDPKQ